MSVLGTLAVIATMRRRVHVGVQDAGHQVGGAGPEVPMQTPTSPLARA